MDIKVLGTGCANCRTTVRLIEEASRQQLGAPLPVEKVEDLRAIMGYGVLSTPAVVIDGKVVHAGGVPSREKVSGWFAAPAA